MTDRDQVAREVLTDFAAECEAQGRLGMADEARAYRDLNSEVTGGGIAAASPAPIPLGARVREYTRIDGGWKDSNGIVWGDHDDDGVAELVSALYHAMHPVADRATVERVAQAQWGVAPILSNWEYAGSANRATQMNIARAALRALGYEVAE